MEDKKKADSLFRSLGIFAGKVAIVLVLLGVFMEVFLPDFDEVKAEVMQQKAALKDRLVKTFGNEKAKLYVLSFVQNPAVFYRTSEIAERDAKMDSAVRDMELAIGLLEMHNTDKQVIKRYNDRLDKLKAAAKEKK